MNIKKLLTKKLSLAILVAIGIFIVALIIKYMKIRILGGVYAPSLWPELVLESLASGIVFYFWDYSYLKKKKRKSDFNHSKNISE